MIGGLLLRAATAAGREAWGRNRSPAAVIAAVEAGFDADADLTAVLHRAAATDALVVVAVPMPAVDQVLAAVAEHAPRNPLTDVVSVKKAVLDAVTARGLRARYVGGIRWRGRRNQDGRRRSPSCSATRCAPRHGGGQ